MLRQIAKGFVFSAGLLRHSTMTSFIQLVAAATFLAALPLVQVEASPITYTFEGTATGLLETTPSYTTFTAAPFTITANADTANIVTVLFTNGVYLISLDTDLATMSIAGIGSFEFALGTRVYIRRNELPGPGPRDVLGFGRGGLNGDPLFSFADFAWATYDLATPFGPLSLNIHACCNPIPTTFGGLSSLSLNVSGVTFTATTDTTPPVLTLPASFAVDATSPQGAIVNYTVTATDNSGVTPTVSCYPLLGATFAIGTTTTSCTATDAAGNSSTGSFTVTVNGAVTQLQNLIAIVGLYTNPWGITNSLNTKLQHAIDALNAMKGNSASRDCNSLNAFINEAQAQSGKHLTVAGAIQLIASANQIRAVLGCP